MSVQAITSSAANAIRRLPADLRRFAEAERILAIVLVFTPLGLIVFDDGDAGIRDSISAYYDMSKPAAFYVPLTVGATLFFVNGLLRHEHRYNEWLGAALLGVVLFDHEGWTRIPHFVFAIAFFGGNFVVMGFFSTDKSKWIKVLLGVGIAAALVLWLTVSLFWAEWVSLAIVSLHYYLDSANWSTYRALRRNEKPKLAPDVRAARKASNPR